MSPSNARRKQLQKLAERRAAERRRQRRNRAITIATALVVAAIGGTILFLAFTGNDTKKPLAGPSPSVSPTAIPNPPVQPPPAKVACGGRKPAGAGQEKQTYAQPPPMIIDASKTYTAVMKTSCGTIEIELDAKNAPLTTNSFVFLAQQHFFDGIYFHRLAQNPPVVQGGDPTGTGSGGPGYQFADELKGDEKYTRGVLAMANSGANTNGSQFFIMTGTSGLPPSYSIFGNVVKGMGVVDTIHGQPVQQGSERPAQAIYIESIRIIVT